MALEFVHLTDPEQLGPSQARQYAYDFLASMALGSPYERIESRRPDSAWLYGAVDDGRLIGGFDMVLPREMSSAARINYLGVVEGRRSEGIGTRLLGAAEAAARSLGKTVIIIEPSWGDGRDPTVNSPSAGGFYLRRGYKNLRGQNFGHVIKYLL